MLLAALVAGLARGFSGFGAALIFIPLASAAMGPRIAVPLLLVADGVMTVGLIPRAWQVGERRTVLVMALGTVMGVPLGTYALLRLDAVTLRWAIILIIVFLLALLLSGWRYRGRPKPWLTVAVGALAGVFSGAAQMGGPPVVTYWLGGSLPRLIVRANIILYFAVSTAITVFTYLWSGLFNREVLWLAALTAPVYGIGLWAGSHIFGLASDRTFRLLSLALIALAAILSLPILDGILR